MGHEWWRRFMLTGLPKGNLKERGHMEGISTDGKNINIEHKITWTWRLTLD